MSGYDGHDIATVLAYLITLIITYGSQTGYFGKTNADVRDCLVTCDVQRPNAQRRWC